MTYLDLIKSKHQNFFFTEFKLFIKEKKNNKDTLYKLIQEGFEKWDALLNTKRFEKAPQLFSIFTQIEKDTSLYKVPSENRLNVYIEYLNYQGISFFDELTIVFLNILQENERRKWKAKTYNTLIYTIFSKITYELYQRVRLSIRKHNQVVFAEQTYANKYTFESLPAHKHFLLYELEVNIWRKYLASLINDGYNLTERSKLTHIDKTSLHNEEERVLWKWLRQQLCSN